MNTQHKILVTDDEPHARRVLRMVLEREGYAVETAGNGAEALARVRNERPAVMITDINMPIMAGRALCETVRKDFPDEPFLILVMTSLTEREERDWVRGLTNVRFLEKPLSTRKLVHELAAYFSTPVVESEASHA